MTFKKPYLVSAYEVDSAAENKLFDRLFVMGHGNADDDLQVSSEALDLLSLKRVVRDSYDLCNFSAQEIMWESV